uniref:Aminopeptidase N n=2 Tax=Culex tarsalis TaxID=7177 RepID=A0A1Q3FGJ4_CULTA
MIRMIAPKSVLLCVLVVAGTALAADRPLSKSTDVDPPLFIAPELETYGDDVIVPVQEIDEEYRLPKTSVPTRYEVLIRTEVHSGDRSFEGTVDIYFTVLQATNDIVIHQRDLAIQSFTLYSLGVSEIELATPQMSYNAQYNKVTFTSSTLLQPNANYKLVIRYTGKLANDEDGFYISSYVDDDGVTKYLATTQFESTSAREAFPCYDEPDFKARFTIKIMHHGSYTARSNMGVAKEEDIAMGYKITTFGITPLMSTYLVAFVVSNFDSIGTDTQRVYVRPNAIKEAEFAQEAGEKILAALDSHLKMRYSEQMPEMKQFAIPDFAAGAMENWGLVTYREQYLLFNPALSTYRTKTNIATIIAHEYAHQWFGNLVSPEWWEYIWLNEGFATLYEYYATHQAYPDMEYWELFNLQVIQAAMVPDGLESTRPMTWNADSPQSISRLFDRVAYPKSGSVLNMMRNILGDENWATGLRLYLQARQYKGANAEHLYEGLQAAIEGKDILPAGMTIKQIMDSWTTEKGYPVLSVRRSYDSGDVIISQERFISDRKVPNTNVWMLPYNYVNQSVADFHDTNTYSWLTTKAARISTDVPEDQWIIFNKQQVGYYRVNYDERNWELITNSLINNWASVNRLNRAQLIDDAFWLARSERLDFEILMKLLTYLKDEREYAPWTAASNVLSYFNGKLRGTPAYHDFLIMVDRLINYVYSTLSVATVSDTESLLHKYLKQTITNWACTIGNLECLRLTKEALENEAHNKVMVHPDVSSVVYCHGIRNADESVFVYLYNRIYKSQNWAFRTQIIDALGCSRNQKFLVDFLHTALGSGSEINYKPSERTRIIQSVYSGSRVGVDALIEFLSNTNNVNDFTVRLGINTLNSAVANIASRTNNLEEQEKLNTLLTSLGSHITPATASAARATVQANLDWQQSHEGLLTMTFIEDYVNTVDPETTTQGSQTTTVPSPGTTGSPGETTTLAPGQTTTPPPGQTTTLAPTTTTEEPDGAATIAVSLTLLISAVIVTLIN